MKALGIRAQKGCRALSATRCTCRCRSVRPSTTLPSALDQGLGLLIWSPLAGGLLSGKYAVTSGRPEGSRHATDWDEPPVYDEDKKPREYRRRALVEVGDEHWRVRGSGRIGLAAPGGPAVMTPIVGARTEEQLAGQPRCDQLAVEAVEEHAAPRAGVAAPTLTYPFSASEEDPQAIAWGSATCRSSRRVPEISWRAEHEHAVLSTEIERADAPFGMLAAAPEAGEELSHAVDAAYESRSNPCSERHRPGFSADRDQIVRAVA